MVEPLDCVVPFGQAFHTILSSHRGRRPSNLKISRMLVTKDIDEVENTSWWGPQPPVYSNPASQQQMSLPRVEAVVRPARPLSSADWLLRGQPNELPLEATTRCLNDMMTTPFA